MERILGINGLGRIGKMSVWHNIARGHFDRLVVNIGRTAGRNLADIANYLSYDSTYGALHTYLHGINGKPDFEIRSEESGEILLQGMPVKILREARNPKDIKWREEGVDIVVETTGTFVDPYKPADVPGGSLRGHIAAGARLTVLSAAFKAKPDGLPEDSLFLVYGANHHKFQAARHQVISAASCTTTALAHMLLPLLNAVETSKLVTAGMSTVHSATNNQSLLDKVPKSNAKDLRRNRSVFDNIIVTTTNAAKALEWVLPEVSRIGFLADSVRVPISTGSLIILNCTFQSKLTEKGDSTITRDTINRIYRSAMENGLPNLVEYSDEQNVSGDMKARNAAVIIEGSETHTRTGFLNVTLSNGNVDNEAQIPVTHAKVFGWYDNELGSYTNRLGDLVEHLDNNI